MSILNPRRMPLAVLTAALQEPPCTTREAFQNDPLDAAIASTLWWIKNAKLMGFDGIQLSSALARPDSYVPAEQMLDPVAAHLPVRTKTSGEGEDLNQAHADMITRQCRLSHMQIFDIGFFENCLHRDERIRDQVQQHLLRCARASVMLKPAGCRGVAGFIGRDTTLDIHQNLLLFENEIIPILKEFQAMGAIFWVENCPMPGWSPTDTFVQNIAYCPFMWVLVARIAEKHGVGDVLRITYDESHDILMGSSHIGSFAFLAAAGYSHLIDRVHSKDQNRNPGKVAAHGMLGQRAALGIHDGDGNIHTDPAKLGNAWKRMTAEHTLPGLSQYNPYAMHQGLKVDWLSHQLGLRQTLGLNVERSVCIIEHEWQPARDQNARRVLQALKLSAQFMRGVDAAADAIHRSQQWCAREELPWQAFPHPYDELGHIEEEAQAALSYKV